MARVYFCADRCKNTDISLGSEGTVANVPVFYLYPAGASPIQRLSGGNVCESSAPGRVLHDCRSVLVLLGEPFAGFSPLLVNYTGQGYSDRRVEFLWHVFLVDSV